MINEKIKLQVIKALHSKILSETGKNLSSCNIEIQDKVIMLHAEFQGEQLSRELGTAEKMIMKQMFVSKLVSYIKKKNPLFYENLWIILYIDFTKNTIEVLTENKNKKGDNFYYNFNF